MRNKLLITTALVAAFTATNVYAEDLNLSEDKNIVQKDYIVEDNKLKDPGHVEGNVTKQDDGNINITGGTIKIDTMYAAIDHMGNGNINIKDNANIIANGLSDLKIIDEETGELYNPVSNAIVHTGDGNINIQGGNISLDNAGIFKVPGCSGGGYGDMCVGTPNEVSGDINISGGNITAINGSVINSEQKINISGGDIKLTSSGIISMGNTSISGENTVLNLTNSDIETNGELIVSGGEINLNFDASEQGYEEESDDPYNDYYGLWSDKTFSMSDGEINMNGDNHYISSAQSVAISGGTLNVNGDNALISAVDDITISGGEINIAQGKTLSVVETKEVEGDSDEHAFGDKKTLNITNSGIVNLSGTLVSDVSGNGNLNIKTSSALVDGDVSGSNLTFEADHSLSKLVSGTIGDLASLNVNKGTLTYAPTGKIGNLNVAGGLDIGTNTIEATSVDFKDNSSLALRVAATDNYGKINADKIGIGNETTIKITLDNGVVGSEGETFKFLNSGNIDGEFTNRIAENGRYNIVQNKDGSFNVTQKDTTVSDVVVEAGGTASNAATAEAWDTLVQSSMASANAKAVASVLNDLSQETSAAGKQAYVDALTAVAPEVAPMVQKTQTETANQVFGAVGTRLTGGSVSTGGEGMSSGDNIFERVAVWVQGMFNHSKLDDTSKAKGFDADSSGVAMGIEKFVTDDVKVGAGYAYTNTDIDGFMRSTDVDTHTAILYGEYKPSNWYVNGIATYGWSDYSEDRNVGGQNINADYDVETFGLQAMTGYDMQVKNFGLTPEVGLRYVHIKQDAYTDGTESDVSGNDSDILTGVIGAKVNKTFALDNGMLIKPEARIAATYDLFNDDVNSVVTLANGSAYAVEGESLDRFGMEFGAGVTAEVNDNVEFALGYEGKFREDYQDHTGLVNLKYKF